MPRTGGMLASIDANVPRNASASATSQAGATTQQREMPRAAAYQPPRRVQAKARQAAGHEIGRVGPRDRSRHGRGRAERVEIGRDGDHDLADVA